MFKLKDIIFNFFAAFEFRSDPNKDAEGKGTNQRFHEMLAEDWDDNLIPLLNSILDNTIVPETLLPEYIPYIEQMLGITVLVPDLNIRREIIKNWFYLVSIKGTLLSYQLLFKLLGFTDVAVEGLTFKQGFDSPLTFDDEVRRFDDSGCQTCTRYTLKLSGTVDMTPEVYELILKALTVVEPINAKLYSIEYNTEEVSFIIFVKPNGDLVYEIVGVTTDFVLKPNGDLHIISDFAESYFIDNNGNLKKNG